MHARTRLPREEPLRITYGPTPAAPRQYSKAVERMRAVCRAATITIPPSLYVKNKSNEALEEALGALLSKHGLSENSGETKTGCCCSW